MKVANGCFGSSRSQKRYKVNWRENEWWSATFTAIQIVSLVCVKLLWPEYMHIDPIEQKLDQYQEVVPPNSQNI